MELIDIVNENNEFTGQIEEREIAYENIPRNFYCIISRSNSLDSLYLWRLVY